MGNEQQLTLREQLDAHPATKESEFRFSGRGGTVWKDGVQIGELIGLNEAGEQRAERSDATGTREDPAPAASGPETERLRGDGRRLAALLTGPATIPASYRTWRQLDEVTGLGRERIELALRAHPDVEETERGWRRTR